MADGRERAAWGRTYAAVVHAAAVWGRRPAPGEVVPARYLPEGGGPGPDRAGNRARLENDLGWAALGAYLRAGVRG